MAQRGDMRIPLSERIRRHLFSEPWQAGCLLCLILGLGWYASARQGWELEAELRQRLLGQTVALAQTIAPDEVAALSFTGADVGTQEFIRMRDYLLAYGRLLPETRWVYMMAQRNGQIVFGPDNVAMDDPDGWDPPGIVYQHPPPGLKALFARHDSLILGPYTDEYGTYVSAFAPIIHLQTGEVVALVAQDVAIEHWRERIWRARMAPVLPTLSLLLLLWAGLRAVAWRSRLPLPQQRRWHHLEVGFTVVFGVALTAWLAAWVDDAEARQREHAFQQMAEGLAEPIRSQCFRVRDQLAAIARFAANRPALTDDDFHAFVAPMARGLPVVALEWIPRMSRDGAGGSQYPIALVEPLAGNEMAVGFDLGSEPVRAATLAAAAATGLMTGSPPVSLIQGDGAQRGTLVFQGVYEQGATPEEGAGGRRLRGFAVAVVRLPVLFESALSRIVRQGNDQVRLAWLDLTLPYQVPKVLLRYPPGEGNAGDPPLLDLALPQRNCVQPLFIFGRTYALLATPGDGFMAAHPRRNGWLVGAMGLILTASLAIFVGFLRERQVSLDELVRERTAALHESEGRYRAFMDSTTDLAFIKDAELRYLFVNRANREFFHRPEQDIIGHTDAELLPANVARQCARTDHRALAENRTVMAEEQIGENIYEVRKFPLPLPAGGVGVAGLIRDVSDLRHGEERRQEMERQLFHSQKLESLGLMAGGIAHDFNNLLAAIQGNAQLALLKLPPDETPVTKSLQSVILAAQNAAGLTRQLLAYSGKTRMEMQPIRLDALLADNAAMFRAVISKSIELNLIPAATEVVMTADPGQAQQVVMNLLTNAAEAMADDGGAITLSAGAMDCDEAMLAGSCVACRADPGRYAWIEVADTGCGMDAETRQRIFDPFFTTKEKGHGLGMSAMLGIVRRHRGAIFVDSEPGHGTTIRVLFPAPTTPPQASPNPASAVPPPNAPEVASAEAAQDGQGHLSGTVLMIDDEAMFRDFCGELIGSFGCRVLAADSGAQGVAMYRKHAAEVDCVLLDMIMPGMDGVAVFDALAEFEPPPPVVICSGLSQQDVTRRMGSRTPAGFVQKPFDLPTVKAALAKVLSRRKETEK